MNLRISTAAGISIGAFVLMLLLPVGAPVHAASGLFLDVPAPAGVGVARAMAPSRFARDTRYVELDLSALGDTQTTLNVFPGKLAGTLTAVWDRAEETSPDSWAWIGKVDGIDDSEVVIVVDVAKGIAEGSIVLPGALYRIRYAGQGVHVVEDIDSDAFPEDIVIPVKTPHPDTISAAEAEAISDAAADAAVTLDVLVLYTPAAETAAGGAAGISNKIDLAVTETNLGYANSGVYHRLRLVRKQKITYNENTADPFGDALNWVTANGTAASARNTYGADLVAFIIDNNQYCGLAWLMQTVSSGFAGNAFSVTAHDCATGYYSFGHEIGHNMGARHDRAVDNTNNSPYAYNHGYVAPDQTWRTIMAYGNACSNCTRINRWSNPQLKHNGTPTGVPASQPTAADNRKTLNNTAPTVANFRASVACTAHPTISPTSRTATAAGGTNSVTVTGLAACTWGANSNKTWITITAGATGSGNGTVNYRVKTNAGGARSGTLKIAGRIFTVNQAAATACGTSTSPCPLTSGVAKTGLSGAANSLKYYSINVPAGATKLVVRASSGSGNVDLYVRRGAVPTTTTYTCRDTGAGTDETCRLNNPLSGTWYILLRGPGVSYSNVTLRATVTVCNATTAPGCPLTNGVGKGLLSGAAGSQRYYYIDLPSGRPSLTVTTSGGSGDVDLYVRSGAAPTLTTYTCRSISGTNTETCTRTSPVSGRWYIMLYGYGSYSGVTLKAQH